MTTPSPIQTRDVLRQYEMRAARVSAVDRTTDCGEGPQRQGH
jgi:hypothetical protein